MWIDLASTPFSDANIITCETELLPAGNKIDFNLLDDDDFTIPYILDTVPNSPYGYQIPTQDKRHFGIIYINGEEHIT